MIMTGGGPGIMEAANRGAFDAGAKSVGLNISLPHEQFPNPYVTPDLCFQLPLLRPAQAAFPAAGQGAGRLSRRLRHVRRTVRALTLMQTRKIKPMPVVLVGESYWRQRGRLRLSGRRRRHRPGGPRAVLVRRDGAGDLGRHPALVRGQRRAAVRPT